MLSTFSIYISNPLLHSVSGFINLKSYYSLYGTYCSVGLLCQYDIYITQATANFSYCSTSVPFVVVCTIILQEILFLGDTWQQAERKFLFLLPQKCRPSRPIFSTWIISKSGGSKQAKCMEGKMWQMLSASLVSKFWSFYTLLVNLSYPKLTDQNAKHGFVSHLTNSMACSQVAC